MQSSCILVGAPRKLSGLQTKGTYIFEERFIIQRSFTKGIDEIIYFTNFLDSSLSTFIIDKSGANHDNLEWLDS